MPKRIPTPEPGPDEPKYYTVVHPYPPHLDWQLDEDCREFGRWIACCLGGEGNEAYFFALFWKPSARGQVIIEIARDFEFPERLLGEHRWAGFLKKPMGEEHTGKSAIFYSTYNSGRAVQKDGWRKVEVKDSWFRAWRPQSCNMVFPYPLPVWCQVPPEDRTTKPMCRPLPGSVVTPPLPVVVPPPARAVPGSSAWLTQRDTPSAGGRGRGRSNGGAPPLQQRKTERNIPASSTAPWHHTNTPTTRSILPKISPSDASIPAAVRHVLSPRESDNAYIDELYNHEDENDPDLYVPDWERATSSNPLLPANSSRQRTPNLDNDPLTAMCPVTGHGRTCKKGICTERAKMVRRVQHRDAEEKRAKERKEKEHQKRRDKIRAESQAAESKLQEDLDYQRWDENTGISEEQAKWENGDWDGNGWGGDDSSWQPKEAADGQQEETATPSIDEVKDEPVPPAEEQPEQKEETTKVWSTKRKSRKAKVTPDKGTASQAETPSETIREPETISSGPETNKLDWADDVEAMYTPETKTDQPSNATEPATNGEASNKKKGKGGWTRQRARKTAVVNA
ncbi:hypothetical protein MIND_00709400 [Mycena indigotica]|uniref:Uncharacterized protein n=1 Tax=Mycena indigotica TaxID=2126181 RepID=A0A8H6W3D2_9AGAR|nr:uncharacterized protein MIND_00709400 [Mycena indigotica]KAF7301441.1 hypothetical protein MIND_00709400 [Mycena indigotica]